MRIISGKYKDRNIISMQGSRTRPTSDKVRESIFDVLASRHYIQETVVLDLFGGTGALGIEALSRGAAEAVFVDKNPDSAAIIRKNLSFVSEPARVYNTDWKVAVKKLTGRKFDLIFIDPPYGLKIESDVISHIISADILAADGCMIIEHSSDNNIGFDADIFNVYQKRYSGTTISYVSYKKEGT